MEWDTGISSLSLVQGRCELMKRSRDRQTTCIYVALLRAVNVGGTGKLAMSDLKAICHDAGFSHVQTYIASGNVVFQAKMSAGEVKEALEERLSRYAGKPVSVAIRTIDELAAIVEANPFKKELASKTVAIFLDEEPPADALKHARGREREKIRLGRREVFVHYVDGIGRSKLRIPAAGSGTARNMNTVAKLAAMAAKQKAGRV
jgi:uncharacterized protein (DUF1697 family)